MSAFGWGRRAGLCVGSIALSACAQAEPDPAVLADQVMGADRAFAAASAERGADAWVETFSDDGVLIRPGSGEVRGPDAIGRIMRPFFESGGTLRWSPIRAEVSGDLGYTVGTYVSESPAPDGSPNSGQGMYVTIWRRGPDGVWKAVVDLGNPTEAVDQTPGG